MIGADPQAAAAAARDAGAPPSIDVAVIAGSGLGALGERLTDAVTIPYAELPGWPPSRVEGHAGALSIGTLGVHVVAVAMGRAHLYEGHSAAAVAYPVRVLRALGARTLVTTNAAGGLSERLAVGDVMVIRDHIGLPGMAGWHPLRGANDSAGPRFPVMADAYDLDLGRRFAACAESAGWAPREGVYAMVAGPTFETPAEARMLAAWGADAVGMSTVPEVLVARQVDLRVLGLSVITNRVAREHVPALREGTAGSAGAGHGARRGPAAPPDGTERPPAPRDGARQLPGPAVEARAGEEAQSEQGSVLAVAHRAAPRVAAALELLLSTDDP